MNDVPQKLKYVCKFTGEPGQNLRFGSEAITNRPLLTVLLMQILVDWSHLELRLADSLACSMHTQPDVGVEVFLSLEHNAAQLKVVEDTAALVLDDADFALFFAIITLVRRAGRERNIVAHGVWGTMDGIPDGLVLLPRKALVRFTGPLAAFRSSTVEKFLERYEPNSYLDVINDSSVYFRKEFEETRELIRDTSNFLTQFWKMQKEEDVVVRARLRRQLCDEPAIQEVICRQSKDQTVLP